MASGESPERWRFGATRTTHETHREPDGQDQRVDSGCPVSLRVPAADEQQQPGDERRVDGQIDRIAGRREADVGAEQLRIAVGVEIAGEEEGLAENEEQPRRPRPGPVQPDPDGDRDRGREPDQVDQGTAALDLRYDEVGGGREAARNEIPEPDAVAPAPCPSREGHAANSACLAGWRSNLFATSPRTSTSSSISARVFAAVI